MCFWGRVERTGIGYGSHVRALARQLDYRLTRKRHKADRRYTD
jgi:hypothetical protein